MKVPLFFYEISVNSYMNMRILSYPDTSGEGIILHRNNWNKWQDMEKQGRMSMKRRICGTLLAVAVVLTSVNFPAAANAEDNSSDPGVAVTVTGGSEEDTEQKDGPQTIHVSAANSCGEDAVLRTYLENAEDASADTETEALDLDAAMKDALTLADGTNTALDAQWVEQTDDSGNVTARYLEAALPAGASAAFDMQLMYRTDEANYTKRTIVQAKAFVNEQDVTQASDQEDEDNETEVMWEMVQSDDVSEAAEESEGVTETAAAETEAAALLNTDGTSAQADENTGCFYYVPSDDWINNGYTIRANMRLQGEDYTDQTSRWSIITMTDSGRTLNGKSVYVAEFTTTQDTGDIPYGGIYTLQIQAYSGETHKGQVVPIQNYWTPLGVFNGKLWDGSNWVDFIPDVVSLAGTELKFVDMTQELSEGSVTAVFRTDNNNQSNTYTINGTFRVPEDYNGTEEYTEVQLNINNQSTQWYSLKELVQEENTCYYYGVTELPSGELISRWAAETTGNESISGRTLYFYSGNFSLNDTIIIAGKEEKISERYIGSVNTLYYKIPDDISADQETIITVVHESTTYHFMWKDLTKNKVAVSDNVAEVSGIQSSEKTVYFDATLSKLYYGISKTNSSGGADNTPGETPGKASGNAIPASEDGNVYYWMRKDQNDSGQKGTMTKVNDNLYKCTVPAGYTEITFAAYPYDTANAGIAWNGDGTDWLEIPAFEEPCFYADSGDSVTYYSEEGNTRGGYWDEKGALRDAEKGKNTDVVDIKSEAFEKEADTMYVNSTFYDYYTDYELNGCNRDNYEGENGTSQRNWVTFRQFDQALSDYYRENNVQLPIYTGHFQLNEDRNQFQHIADTLNLFGWNSNQSSDDYKKFLSTNNSVLNIRGEKNDSDGTPFYDYAAWGLVSDQLENEELYTSESETLEPHFNKAFLLGENSKNAKLGEVYENVSFPFKKVKNADGVDYWTFDSAETTLAMRKDTSSDDYYLKDVGNQDWARNVNSTGEQDWDDTWDNGTQHATSTEYGFFPFNETSTGSSGVTYNYGFGTKIEFNFRLTEDGTVLAEDPNSPGGTKEVPITFEFSGDDDVWVFIDGKLALDVGGAHGRVTGNLNFKDKTATVSHVKASAADNTQGADKTSKFEIQGENGSIHTLTMYYMERGMWESNMKITFNFPDENLFEVEKQVDTTDVNTDIFDEELFTNTDSFAFNIKNAVTHWGEKEVSGEETQSVEFNSTFRNDTVHPSVTDNLFQHEDSKDGHNDVVHWRARYEDDADGTYKDKRWGIISPENGSSVNIEDQEYLSFDFYFDDDRIPSLNNMRVCLEDINGKTCDVKLSSQNTFGSASLTSRTWKTIRVYLDRIPGIDTIDKTKIAKVKLAFRYERDIYLDNIVFEPQTTMDVMTGFTVQQADIPDYGSVQANRDAWGAAALVNPTGAVYTVTNENGGETTYGRIGASGEFSLGDGDTASFSNQFRIGSYIYLEETGLNKEAFTTSWSLYDNGVPVTSYGSGDSVINPSTESGLVNQKGYALEDGRTEKKDTNSPAANYNLEEDTSEPSIVFRSYTNPDSRAIATKLKAVVVNKVNTGSISITKEAADNSPILGEAEYTFKITFTNIAGSSLESEPIIVEVKVKAGETETITGIPIGTDYVIEEVSPTDGSRLESIVLPEENEYVEIVNNTVHGLLMKDASEGDATKFVFKNTKRPLIDISVEKMWQDGSGEDISDSIDSSIYIQLQRKYTENGTEHPFEVVEINGQSYIQIQKGYEGWKYEFTGLEKYQDQDCKIPYTYRVVEGTIGDDGEFQPTDEGGIIVIDGQEYVVDYQCKEIGDGIQDSETTDDITGNDESTQSQTFTATIINKIQSKTNLKIVKVDASATEKKLGGVEFTLEKGNEGSTSENFILDTSFGTNGSVVMITGSEENDTILGEAQINDLEEGIYRITETKAAAGYSLLKSPLYLVIDREHGCTIQEGSSEPQNINVDADTNTITITVSNRLLFELPSTGGYLRAYMIAGGLALAGLALFIYRLQKRRKGARAPRK